MPTVGSTVPYAWPYDGDLDPARLGLIVAGAQEAWASRSSRSESVTAALTTVRSAVRAVGALVVLVRHVRVTGEARDERRSLPPLPESAGWNLALPVQTGDVVIDAAGIDGFYGSPMDALLRSRGITHLVLGGFGHEAAVDSTLRSANDRGYECLVLSDCVAPFNQALGGRALSSVTMSGGIFGAVGETAHVLTALAALRP